jgi:hypothetical protein
MKIPFAKVLEIAKAIYLAFLKGRTITVPGIGPVTLPSQGNTIPGGFGTPHEPGPPVGRPLGLVATPDTRRAWDLEHKGQDPKREEGLATPIYLPVVGFLFFCLVGAPLALLIAAGAIEAKTLGDDVPGNHLTAQLRAIFARQPAACALGLGVWVAFVVAIVVGVAAHAWWF